MDKFGDGPLATEVRNSFVEGLYDSDGDKSGSCTRIDTKGKTGAMGLYRVYESLGYAVSINTRADKSDIYRVTYSKQGLRKPVGVIKKITSIGKTNDYVYDLTTDNHHFHAGVGGLIVHNTDSVMVEFKTETEGSIQESWDMGVKAAAMATEMFKYPNELELEKIYTPFFLFSKKRYAALKYEDPNEPPEIDVKGIQLVRRDNCKLVKKVSKEVKDLRIFFPE